MCLPGHQLRATDHPQVMSWAEQYNAAEHAGHLSMWRDGLLHNLVQRVTMSQPENSTLHATWARLAQEDFSVQVTSKSFPRLSEADLEIPASHVTRAKESWNKWCSTKPPELWRSYTCSTLFQSSEEWFSIQLQGRLIHSASVPVYNAGPVTVSV